MAKQMSEKPSRGGARPGSGPKVGKEGKIVPVSAGVPELLVRKLEKKMELEGWSRSEAVTEAIRRLVKNVKVEALNDDTTGD